MNATRIFASFLVTCGALITPAVFAAGNHKDHTHEVKKEASHSHDAKPMHGGVVATAKDVNYELVATTTDITLYVMDHDQPLDTGKSYATLTMLSGTEKSEVKLVPGGKNVLKAEGTFQVAAGTKVVAVVRMDGKAVQSVRFVLK